MSDSGAALHIPGSGSVRRSPCALCIATVFYAVVALLPLLQYYYHSLGLSGTPAAGSLGLALDAYRSWDGLYFGCAALCAVLLFRRRVLALLPAAVVTSWFWVGVAVHLSDWSQNAGLGYHLVRGGIWCGVYLGVFMLVLWLRNKGALK